MIGLAPTGPGAQEYLQALRDIETTSERVRFLNRETSAPFNTVSERVMTSYREELERLEAALDVYVLKAERLRSSAYGFGDLASAYRDVKQVAGQVVAEARGAAPEFGSRGGFDQAYEREVARLKELLKARGSAGVDQQGGGQNAAMQQLLGQYRDLLEPQSQFIAAEKDLQKLRDAGLITVEQQQDAMARMYATGLTGATTMAQGLKTSLARVRVESMDDAKVVSEVFDSGVNSISDAIADFAESGKMNFRDFARTAINEINRIIIRALVLKAVNSGANSFFGGSSGGDAPGIQGGSSGAQNTMAPVTPEDAGGFQGSFASGGYMRPGMAGLVGEHGPELFTPKSAGQITPLRMQKPVVTVQVVNVTDPNMVASYIVSGKADKAILNVMHRNRNSLQNVSS